MTKGKGPRKRRKPARGRKAAAAAGAEPQARTKAALVPAAGADLPARDRAALSRVLQLLRSAVGAMLDVADAAAGTITRGRATR